MTTRWEWAAILTSRAGAHPGAEAGIVAQIMGENTEAANNPLATERDWPGATDFNSAGVKNYPDLESGIEATLATLRDGVFPEAIAGLMQGNSTAYVTGIASSGAWTFPHNIAGALGTLAAVEHNHAVGDLEVPGTPPEPPQPPQPPEVPPMFAKVLDPIAVGQGHLDAAWWVRADGSVYAYDGARFLGSPDAAWNWPSVGELVAFEAWRGDGTDQHGNGYRWVLENKDGSGFSFYEAPGDASIAHAAAAGNA